MEDSGPPELDTLSLGSQEDERDTLDSQEEDRDMFTSAVGAPQADSPSPDSGLADTLGSDLVVTDNNVTPSSDTMEDLSMQDEEEDSTFAPPPAAPVVKDPVKAPPPEDDDDLFVSVSKPAQPSAAAAPTDEVNLEDDDDDDDIFKSARLEPEPAKAMPVTNGSARQSQSPSPADTEIPLEEEGGDSPYSAPELQLSGPAQTLHSSSATLTSFRDEEAKMELEGGDEFIEVKVTSPHKVGEGMSSYMAYTVTTSTNLSYFKKKNPAVNRRFSDFLGLRDKLAEKYLQNGRIIPPAPDKSVLGMTKVKMSKEDEDASQSEFVEKRRASLERYLNRTAGHPNLRVDPDFREFLELDAELPKSNQTSALSGKNVMKMITKVGDRVSAYTTKMEETDTWFEEKTVMVENLDNQLRKLHVATEAMVEYRKGLSGHTYTLSKSLSMLGSAEDNTKLAAALAQLAEVEEKVEKVHEQQAKDDFFLMSELVRDYIGIVGSVREAFNERVKAWQSWQGVQRDLNKRREGKVKAELAGKQDRVNTLRQEIAENERQVDMAQENFEKISRIIRKEFDAFDIKKCQDFKQTILQYLEQMLKSQESWQGVQRDLNKWKKHCSALAESYIRATRSSSLSQLPLLYPRSPQSGSPAPRSPGPPRPLPCMMPAHVEHHCSSHHQPSPLSHLRHLQSPRRHSWGDCTPEAARDLQWSSPLDGRSPFSTLLWEGSPLRGSPAKRLFSWSSWQGGEAEQDQEEDDMVFGLKELELR